MLRRKLPTLVMLIGIALSASCSPSQASPTPTMTVAATASSSGGDAPESGPAAQESPTPAIVVEATSTASGGAGGYMPPGTAEEIADWWGVIKSTPPGAQYDDYFERQDLGQQFIYFGIDSRDPAVEAQIETLRDSGNIVHLYGTWLSDVPDYNGSQIQVSRIEIEE